MASKACCEIPPVVAHDYTPKGAFETAANFKSYITGRKSSKTGILVVFDIFGYFPQTLQGADILASAGHLVVMPDFFKGEAAEPDCYPPDTPEKGKALMGFLNGPANFKDGEANVRAVAEGLKKEFTGVERWGIVGYCWGGKVAVVVSGPGTPFTASVQLHPAMMDVEDVKKVTIPHLVLPSKDEPADVIEAYKKELAGNTKEAVKARSCIEVYDKMVHGWMAARAQLADEEVLKGYERGYKQVITFFGDTL
ncbi:alpha/beta-hydrolase [Tuber magnatum]|uniref:Alpha/beta-hydrolase n=1 Tax=Tuber magnatum TaxID=42249 RepID=A0A317SKD0_9PEZI|nr:alpha/beta-hydrolase [Tuber magnatum]